MNKPPRNVAPSVSLKPFISEWMQEAGELLFGECLEQELGNAEVVVVGELDV